MVYLIYNKFHCNLGYSLIEEYSNADCEHWINYTIEVSTKHAECVVTAVRADVLYKRKSDITHVIKLSFTLI